MTSNDLDELFSRCDRAIQLLLGAGFPHEFLDPIFLQARAALAEQDRNYLQRLARELKQCADDLPKAKRMQLRAIFDSAEQGSECEAADEALRRNKIGNLKSFRLISDHVENLISAGAQPERVELLNQLLAAFTLERMRRRQTDDPS